MLQVIVQHKFICIDFGYSSFYAFFYDVFGKAICAMYSKSDAAIALSLDSFESTKLQC